MTKIDKFLKSLLVGIVAVAFILAAAGQAYGQPCVATDKPDYPPGSTVQISGSGFAPGEIIQLQVLNLTSPNDNGPEHDPWQITNGVDGNFQATWFVMDNEANQTLRLTATGLTSGLTAQMTFTDAAKVWVGGASGAPNDWGTAANWSLTGVPKTGDDVIIPTTATFFPILTNGQSFTVNSITVQASATLTINSGASLDASGKDPVITGTINTAGTLNFGTRNINNAENTGTINVSGGTVTVNDVNETAMNFNISGGSVYVHNYSANTIMSGGLLQSDGAFTPNTFSATGGTVRLTSAGSVPALAYYNLEISGGAPKLAGDLTVAGNLAIDTGAKLNLNGKSASVNSLTLGGVAQTAGTFNQTNVSTYISGNTSLTVSAGAAAKLAFTTQPVNTTAGSTIANVVVQVQDAAGNSVSLNGVAITLTLNGSTLYSGTNPQTTDSTGKATFSNLVIRQVGTGLNFSAAASGLTGITSSNFNITTAAPSRLAFTTQPAGTTNGATMTALVVQLQDQFSNNIAGSGTIISLTLNGGGTLGGTTSRATAANGQATFTDLTITGAGSGLTFTASASPLTGATSSAFNVVKAFTTVTVLSSLNHSGCKDAVTFTATLPTDATGNVIFTTANAPFCTSALVGGSATSLPITDLPRGTNVITVQYVGDSNYLGSTNSLVQIVTNHLPVATSFSVTVNNLNTFKMDISDLLTNVTDVDGDTIALTGFTTSTNGVGIITTATLFQYSNTNNVHDQFSYIVNDGFGGSATGVVTVIFNAFGLGNPQTGQAGLVMSSAGVAHLTCYGIPTYQYGIQRSTDMATWVTIQTTDAPSGGVFNYDDDFSDLGAPPSSAFYRLIWNP